MSLSTAPGASPDIETPLLTECVAELASYVASFGRPPVGGASVARLRGLLERAEAEAGGCRLPAGPLPLVAPASSLLRLYLALHGRSKVAARQDREWPLQLDVSRDRVRPVDRPERRRHAAYTDEPLLEWHPVLVVEEPPDVGGGDGGGGRAVGDECGVAGGSAGGVDGGGRDVASGGRIVAGANGGDDIGVGDGGGGGDIADEVGDSGGSGVGGGLALLRRKYQLRSPDRTGGSSGAAPAAGGPSKPCYSFHSSSSLQAAPPPEPRLPAGSGGDLRSRRDRTTSVAPGAGDHRSCGRRRAAPTDCGAARSGRAAARPEPVRPVRAVSLAPGGALWCCTADDWEQQLQLISDQAEGLAAAAGGRKPGTLLYGQLVIHHNCVRPELPRFVRCLSLGRSCTPPVLTPVWLCDLGRTLLVRHASLLSAPSETLQLYRRPPLLVLLTGKRLEMEVPIEVVSGTLSLLAALTACAGLELARQLASCQLAQLVAEVARAARPPPAPALRLLLNLADSAEASRQLRSPGVAGPLADVVRRELRSAAPSEAVLTQLVQVLRVTVGPGLADPVRRLLSKAEVVSDLLRLDAGGRLAAEVSRLLARLMEDGRSPVPAPCPRPSAAAVPRRHSSGGAPRKRDGGAGKTRQRSAPQPAGQPSPPALLPTPPESSLAAGRGVSLTPEDLDSDGDEPAAERAAADSAAAIRRRLLAEGGYFRCGQLTRLRCGERLQLESDVRRPEGIGRIRLTQVLSGLLNTGHGGAIYYGLSREGRVVGLKLDRSARDCLRLGLDRVLTDHLLPPLPPDCYRLEFTPVLARDQLPDQYDPARHILFVVAVHCKPAPREVFILRDTGAAYLRRPDAAGRPDTFQLTLPQLRRLVADRELALDEHRQAALREAADCLRLLAGRAAPRCERCHGFRPAEPEPELEPGPVGGGLRGPADSNSSGLEVG